MRKSLLSTVLTTSLLLLGRATPSAAAEVLERDWCVGLSPVSWGFSVNPDGPTSEIHLELVSGGVQVLSADAGPGLPDGWTVTLSEKTLVARGETALTPGTRYQHALLVTTNASTLGLNRQGHEPLTWKLETRTPGGQALGGRSRLVGFPPVLDLADAVSRGAVTASILTRSPAGPVELTVDNNSWKEIWLDVAPGSILTGHGAEWVVGLESPFRMMPKQKYGRTVRAFPVTPPQPNTHWPRSVQLSGRTHPKAQALAELALAAETLDGGVPKRRPGRFESIEPFEFWPLLYQWAAWVEMSQPPASLLKIMVAERVEALHRRGDPMAEGLQVDAVVTEIETALADLQALRAGLADKALSVEQQSAAARFGR